MRAAALLLLVAACSFHPGEATTDGGVVDARPDGSPDAMMLAGRQQMEIVSAAGRLQAGSMTIDVELGRPNTNLRVVTAGTITIEAAPVIAP